MVKRTLKITVTAVIAALSFVCISLTYILPFGLLALYAFAGLLLLFDFKVCGVGYGIVGFLAVSLLVLPFQPNCWPYIFLFGPHALVKFFLTRKAKKMTLGWGLFVSIVVFLFCNVAMVGIYFLASEVFEIGNFVHGAASYFIFSGVTSLIFVLYDFFFGRLVGLVADQFVKMKGFVNKNIVEKFRKGSSQSKSDGANDANVDDIKQLPHGKNPYASEADRADSVESQPTVEPTQRDDSPYGSDYEDGTRGEYRTQDAPRGASDPDRADPIDVTGDASRAEHDTDHAASGEDQGGQSAVDAPVYRNPSELKKKAKQNKDRNRRDKR